MSKELRQLLKAAESQGFTVTATRSGHWLVRDPAGRAVATIAGTSSDHRSWRNAVAELRRAGLQWPVRKR